MLVLTLEPRQRVEIGDNLVVELLEIHRGKIRLGFHGPREIPIVREFAKNKQPKKREVL